MLYIEGGKGREHNSLALVVFASSPVLRNGSILKLAPSSSPTPNSEDELVSCLILCVPLGCSEFPASLPDVVDIGRANSIEGRTERRTNLVEDMM